MLLCSGKSYHTNATVWKWCSKIGVSFCLLFLSLFQQLIFFCLTLKLLFSKNKSFIVDKSFCYCFCFQTSEPDMTATTATPTQGGPPTMFNPAQFQNNQTFKQPAPPGPGHRLSNRRVYPKWSNGISEWMNQFTLQILIGQCNDIGLHNLGWYFTHVVGNTHSCTQDQWLVTFIMTSIILENLHIGDIYFLFSVYSSGGEKTVKYMTPVFKCFIA